MNGGKPSVKKIKTLFVRDFGSPGNPITTEIEPTCLWAVGGDVRPTRKWDGTATMVRKGVLYKRLDVKKGKTPPADFESCERDDTTGHHFGWVPVKFDLPENKWYRAAWERPAAPSVDGTYELCGPHFQANPEGFEVDTFVPHGVEEVDFHFSGDPASAYAEVKGFLEAVDVEGIVFYHADGRRTKIKKVDFGLKRGKAARG